MISNDVHDDEQRAVARSSRSKQWQAQSKHTLSTRPAHIKPNQCEREERRRECSYSPLGGVGLVVHGDGGALKAGLGLEDGLEVVVGRVVGQVAHVQGATLGGAISTGVGAVSTISLHNQVVNKRASKQASKQASSEKGRPGLHLSVCGRAWQQSEGLSLWCVLQHSANHLGEAPSAPTACHKQQRERQQVAAPEAQHVAAQVALPQLATKMCVGETNAATAVLPLRSLTRSWIVRIIASSSMNVRVNAAITSWQLWRCGGVEVWAHR